MPKKQKKSVDPLYKLFEHFLFNRSYDDAEAFAREIAEEYLAYLDSTPAHVPFHSRLALLKDLEAEAQELLVKRMYGCIKEHDYTNYGQVMKVTKTEEKLESFELRSTDTDSKKERKPTP